MVYGAEPVLPAEIKVPRARMSLSAIQDENSRLFDLEALEGKRAETQKNLQVYQRKVSQAYNKLIKPRIFQAGDLLLKATNHALKGLHAPKFSPKWEGPYEIVKVKPSGHCIMKDLITGKYLPPTNLKFVKKYFI